jgi:CheY-like chemotaxis protein
VSGQIRVLHLDDDPSFTELTGKFLEQESGAFETVSEVRAADALEHLTGETTDIDCIVSDYALPGMDGIEFLRTVRDTHPDIPFILFTGRGSESVAGEALANGATDYLQKQGGAEQYELLANRIRNAVEQYRDTIERERTERYRQEIYRITADTDLTVEENVERLLALGCERLGVENGHVTRIDREMERQTISIAAGSDFVQAGTVTDLTETYCRETVSQDDILAVYNAVEEGWGDDAAFEQWGIGCYIGGKIEVGDELYGTVCFVNQHPRDEQFTEGERTFVDLVSRWLSHMFERQAHERELARYEALVGMLPVGYARTDRDGEILTANPALVAMLDAEAESDLRHRSVTEFCTDSAAAEQFLERVHQQGTVEAHELELGTLTDGTVRVLVTGRSVDIEDEQQVDLLVEAASEGSS